MPEVNGNERPVTADILLEAWRLRQAGVYSMRDIAERLNVNREELIAALETYLREAHHDH